MLAKLFELKDAGGKGKGLFAKELIPQGTGVSFEFTQCRRISKMILNQYRLKKRALFSSMVIEK
jgi:hypothetical protein